MLELAERLAKHHLFDDPDASPFDDGRVETEIGLAARCGGMGEDVERRGDDRPHVGISERIDGILHPAGADIGQCAGAREPGTMNFVRVVKHQSSTPVGPNMEGHGGLIQKITDRSVKGSEKPRH